MPFVVRRENGQYLGRGTGARRSWVNALDEADTWKTAGGAKVSYNHVVGPIQRRNVYWDNWYASKGREHPSPEPIPTFEAVEVLITLVDA